MKKMCYLALFFILVTWFLNPLYAQLANSPWPMYRHDLNHMGRSAYNGPESSRLNWRYETGGWISSSPIMGEDGSIYIGSTDNKLYVLNPNGTLNWTYEVTGFLTGSTPVISSDGTIHFGANKSPDTNKYPSQSLKSPTR